MTSVEDYCRRAEECFKLAEQLGEPDRAEMLDLARR